MISSGYCFGKFDTGGFQKSIAPKQPLKAGKPPQRNPDFVFAEKTTPEQAVVYRLSGCVPSPFGRCSFPRDLG
jgi:hypothetical protein